MIPPIRFFGIGLLLTLLRLTGSGQSFTSPHFRLEQLAPGVYAAIATEEGYACANAGIVDLGGKTLVFDTFLSPVAAQDLVRAAEELTHQPITHVVNSHFHNDHIRGNQVFPSTTEIVSTKKTQETIVRVEPEQIAWEIQNVPSLLKKTEEALEEETDFYTLRDLKLQLAYYKAVNKSDAQLKTRIPTLTFEKKLTIRGTTRVVEILEVGNGHTAGDCIMMLPDERIAFVGDLVTIGVHPYLLDGSPEEWLATLQQLDALPIGKLVPGHGAVGQKADITIMSDYIKTIQRLANAMTYQGKKGRDGSTPPVPSQFKSWMHTQNFIQSARFLMDRILSGKP